MRYVYIALIAVLAGVVIQFRVQNHEAVTLTLLSMSFTLPVSVLVFLLYVLVMFTSGFMLQLVAHGPVAPVRAADNLTYERPWAFCPCPCK